MYTQTQTVQKSKRGALLSQLVECGTLDLKVAGLNLTRGAVLCP